MIRAAIASVSIAIGAACTGPSAVEPAPARTPVDPAARDAASAEPATVMSGSEDAGPDATGEAPVAELGDIAVPGDRPVHVVRGAPSDARALVYLPGRCGDDSAFRAWETSAARWGTLIGMLGDEPCEGTSRYRWGTDLRRIEARIAAAIAATGAARGAPLDASVITLIGYSEGATRAEQLVQRAPSRYPRVILGGAPRQPSTDRLHRARAVVVLAGEHDRRIYLKEGADALAATRVPTAFRILPGAGHGEYGPEGGRIMAEALAWLFATAP